MRVIKFRAWEADNQHMEYDPRFFAWETVQGVPFYAINKAGSDPNFVLMLCTGLKDKNGREIYEGDILQAKDGKKVKCEDALRAHYAITPEVSCEWLVLGNIYEHPELLKG